MATPFHWLPRLIVPPLSVPMELPSTMFAEEPRSILTPSLALPEMTFAASGDCATDEVVR